MIQASLFVDDMKLQWNKITGIITGGAPARNNDPFQQRFRDFATTEKEIKIFFFPHSFFRGSQ